MYSCVISEAVKKTAFEHVGGVHKPEHVNKQNLSIQSGQGIGRRSGGTTAPESYDGKVTVGLSTSSSMRSHH